MQKNLWLLLCFFVTCGYSQTKNPEFATMLDSIYDAKVSQISVEDFLKLNRTETYVLDTREEEEFAVSHLKNARNVGYFWFDMRTIYDIPMDASIVVYCTMGNRSEKIAEKLVRAGYHHVYNLYGGIFEWINMGQPVYKSNGVQTSEIHTHTKDWARWVDKGTKVN